MNDKLIFVVGFMGCGKSAVAKELSRLLNKPFVDLDLEVGKIDGRPPAQIITQDGEKTFRDQETKALRALLDTHDQAVVALGGGAWTIAVNRELIRSVESITIWLDVPFDICWQRIEKDGSTRPLAPSRTAAENLYSERLPFYRRANVHVPVSDELPTETAKKINALLPQQSHT
ncbi:MAG TPA: shikimate kinase [Pyrinomonadaceae bacterium]